MPKNINKSIVFVNQTVAQLDGIKKRREHWEANEFKKSNDILYGLLADCYELFDVSFNKASDKEKKDLRTDLAEALKAAGIKVQRNTVTLTMFIRYVFGSDRKRAHAYSYVLKAAYVSSVSPNKLADYIRAKGGIEEVKREMVTSEKVLKKRELIDKAISEVMLSIDEAKSNPIAKVKLEGLTGEYAVLIAKPDDNGDVAVVATLSDVKDAFFEQLVKRIAAVKAEDDQLSKELAREAKDLLAVAEEMEAAA